MVNDELIMNTNSNFCPTLLICSDLIGVKYILKFLIIVVQVPSCVFNRVG